MTPLRLLFVSAIAAAAFANPLEAQAEDCAGPSICICEEALTPTYALDVRVPQGADLSAPVELEVLGAYGDGADALAEEGVFTLEEPNALLGFGVQPGERALLLLDEDAAGLRGRRLTEGGDLDCLVFDGLAVEDAADLVLSEDCRQEADDAIETCGAPASTSGCSVTGAGPTVSVCLLALLGFTRRRESSVAQTTT